MIQVSAQTEIAARAETVWSVLTDLHRFRAWNPLIHEARGSTDVGGDVSVLMRALRLPIVFRGNVLYSEHGHALRWVGHVISPWLVRGDHRFLIQRIADGRVRFVQTQLMSGILPWIASKLLARETKRGFEAMNHALQRRAEAKERTS